MTKYEFGVMSNKWSLQADDTTTAYIAMAIFIGKNIPIAVFSPQTAGFMPKDILDKNKDDFNPKKISECIITIKEEKPGHIKNEKIR